MNELIKIGSGNIGGVACQTVNARDLHVYLKLGKDFSSWVKAQISRARLVESRDYVTSPSRVSSGQPTTDYHLTLDAGKQVAMMSETDKGFDVRDYFLECERRALAPAVLSNAAMFMQSAQLIVSIENQLNEQKKVNLALSSRIEELAITRALSQCPSNAESISHIRKRMSQAYGLSIHIIDTVMRQLPCSLKPVAMVINPHQGTEGLRYAAFSKKDVSTVFKRFVSECRRETSAFVSHPFIDFRFKLDAGKEA